MMAKVETTEGSYFTPGLVTCARIGIINIHIIIISHWSKLKMASAIIIFVAIQEAGEINHGAMF